jgi:hypothetical protein
MARTRKEKPQESSQTDPVVTVPDVEVIEAFEAEKAVLDAMPQEELVPVPISPNDAMARGLRVAENARRDRPLFVATYTNPPLEEIDTLGTRAMAVKGAALVGDDGDDDDQTPDFEKARQARAKHFTLVSAIVLGDTELEAKLQAILPGRGFLDLGDDMITLSAIEREAWPRIEPTGLINKEQVEELEALGVKILRWEEGRQQRSSSRMYVRRALTFLFKAYNTVRDHALVVHRNNPGVWAMDYPSFLTRPGVSRTSTGKVEEKPVEIAPVVTDATPPPPADSSSALPA